MTYRFLARNNVAIVAGSAGIKLRKVLQGVISQVQHSGHGRGARFLRILYKYSEYLASLRVIERLFQRFRGYSDATCSESYRGEHAP
jgi:hypothetical protein